MCGGKNGMGARYESMHSGGQIGATDYRLASPYAGQTAICDHFCAEVVSLHLQTVDSVYNQQTMSVCLQTSVDIPTPYCTPGGPLFVRDMPKGRGAQLVVMDSNCCHPLVPLLKVTKSLGLGQSQSSLEQSDQPCTILAAPSSHRVKRMIEVCRWGFISLDTIPSGPLHSGWVKRWVGGLGWVGCIFWQAIEGSSPAAHRWLPVGNNSDSKHCVQRFLHTPPRYIVQ